MRSSSRLATHGMRDIVDMIADYLTPQPVSFCRNGQVLFVLYCDGTKYSLLRHTYRTVHKRKGWSSLVSIEAGTSWIHSDALDKLDPRNEVRVELNWDTKWAPSIWAARGGAWVCITSAVAPVPMFALGDDRWLLPTRECMLVCDGSTRRVDAVTIRIDCRVRMLCGGGAIAEYPVEYFLQSSLVHD